MKDLPTAQHSGIRKRFSHCLPKRHFPVGHYLFGLKARKLASQEAEDLPVQTNFATGHDHGDDTDHCGSIFGDEVKNLARTDFQHRQVPGDDAESSIDVEERRLLSDLVDHLPISKNHGLLQTT